MTDKQSVEELEATLRECEKEYMRTSVEAMKAKTNLYEIRLKLGIICPSCGGGVISSAHGKCTSCNENFINSLPPTSDYNHLRSVFDKGLVE